MKNIVKRIAKIIGMISPKLLTLLLFRYDVGYWPRLNNPRSLNEKLQYLKLNDYCHNPLVTKCIDKYQVREYVADTIGDKYLLNIFGVWENANDIKFDQLPDSFVLKCNNGSGTNIICKNKALLDELDCKQKLNKWLSQDFGDHRAELLYKDIPGKIICEEYIETPDDLPPKDYKFFCNYGKALFLFVASDRYENNTKFDYYDMNWNWIPVLNGHPSAGPVIEKPHCFDEMVRIVEQLSKPFPLVRVDLYNENNRIIFGEMTFLHHSGLAKYEPEEYDFIFGKMISL